MDITTSSHGASVGASTPASKVLARLEHRLRQIDRLLMQEALTRSALSELLAEKRALMATLGGEALHS